jgi:xanthine dehydrogenase molybdenum-binding subunit
MAIMMHSSGDYPILLEHSNALIKLNEDGSANLVVSPGELGQNIIGALSQIAAEGIGLRYEDIHVIWGDTDATLFDVGSHASRTCYVTGNAVKRAAGEVKKQIIDRAAGMMEARIEDLEVRGGRVFVKGSPSNGITVREIAQDAIYNYKGGASQIIGKCSFEAGQSPVPEAVFAEVEVDIETGEVGLKKMVLAHDIGRSINPMTVEGQLEGGMAQGIGYGLTEDYIVNSETGVLETNNFISYKIPTALDMPEIEIILVEQPVASGPYGAKSAGESPMNAIAPAIANAIYDAAGVRIKDLPITPEKVLKALKAS